MPMWFILSGYYCKFDLSIKKYTEKRIKGLLIPYFCFATFYIVLSGALGNWQLQGMLYPNSVQIPLNGAVWFLPALFITVEISYFILKTMSPFFASVIMIMVSLAESFRPQKFPFALDSALVGVGFFWIGWMLKRTNLLFRLNTKLSVMLLVADSILVFINDNVNMRSCAYGNVILFWLNAVVSSVALWKVVGSVDGCFLNKLHGRISDLFHEIGKNSLIYVLMNQFVLKALDKIGFEGNQWGWKIMEVLLVVCICFMSDKIICKTKLKFVLGK